MSTIIKFADSFDPHSPSRRSTPGLWDTTGWGESILVSYGPYYDASVNPQDYVCGYMNTGFSRGEIRAVVGETGLLVGMHVLFTHSGIQASPTEGYISDFLRLDAGEDTTICKLACSWDSSYVDADNPTGAYFLQRWSGGNGYNGSGAYADTLSTPFSKDEWYYVELHEDGSVWIDGVLVATGFGTSGALRAIARWEKYGYDGFAGSNFLVRQASTPVGPVQIYSCYPKWDASPNQMSYHGTTYDTTPPATENAAYIRERRGVSGLLLNSNHDQDYSYLLGTAGQYDYWSFDPPLSSGTIHAVQIRITARVDDGQDPTVCGLVPYLRLNDISYQPNTYSEVPAALSWEAGETAYKQVVGLFETNPETGLAWEYEDLMASNLGCLVSAGTVRITQASVEVITAASAGAGAYYGAY